MMIAPIPLSSNSPNIFEENSAFVSRHASFAKLIGPGATLQLLLKEGSGKPLFHEAGIYLKESKTVYVSSNRISRSDEHQEIYISRISVDSLPRPTHLYDSSPQMLDALQESEPNAYTLLKNSLVTWTDLPSGMTMPNGATNWTHEGQDAILWCEQGRHDVHNRGVQEVESSLVICTQDHNTTTVLDNYHGMPFCSINDVVVHQQSGIVFFTDPDYGIGQNFKKEREKTSFKSYAPNGLYAWDPASKEVRLLDVRYDKPNGVTFVADPNDPNSGNGLLVTTDTGRFSFEADNKCGVFTVDETKSACIYTYKVTASNTGAGKGTAFPEVDVGGRQLLGHSECPVPDGIHPDEQGNVWTGSGDGLHVWNPWIGKLLGKIVLPNGKGVANFCWAGLVHSGNSERCNGQARNLEVRDNTQGLFPPMYRILLFAEDELWEACVAINGND